jgi:hypothetical protein
MDISTTEPKAAEQPIAPAPPPGQQAQGVSDQKLYTREEVDRILAGRGKEVDRAKADAADADARAKAEAEEKAKIAADRDAATKALADAEARAKELEDRERTRLEATKAEATLVLAALSAEERAQLAGLDPDAQLKAIRFADRRAASAVGAAYAGAVHPGQPRPPSLAAPEPVDYTAAAAARLAARQMGKPLPKKQQ